MQKTDIESVNAAIWEAETNRDMQTILQQLLSLPDEDRAELDAEAAGSCYDRLPEENQGRHLALVMLAVAARPEHLHELVERLVTDPPQDWQHVAYAVSALMRRQDWDVDAVFPRLLDGLSTPSVAAPSLDLANYVVRTAMLETHPATDRAPQLAGLLGVVVNQLERLAENPQAFGDSVESVQAILGESISLSVSLCDALGLIGDRRVIGKLNQAMTVGHRRIQTEAAGALARLEDEEGKKRLLALAAEPSARLRVLAYAEELGLADEVPEEFKTDDARATAELAMWLAQPSQVGLPPTEIEVIDRRILFWPSYTDPVDCALVRYAYRMGERSLSNIGIVGPLTHVFAADMGNLPLDDIYAAFAGWHADHEEIFEVAAEAWNSAQQAVGRQLVKHLEREGYTEIRPGFLGIMLDEHALVADANREGRPCLVATDGLEIVAYPKTPQANGLRQIDIWSIFKGRRMLRSFNSVQDED